MALPATEETAVEVVDLEKASLRELNGRLHDLASSPGRTFWRVLNPNGAHAVACGLDADLEIEIEKRWERKRDAEVQKVQKAVNEIGRLMGSRGISIKLPSRKTALKGYRLAAGRNNQRLSRKASSGSGGW